MANHRKITEELETQIKDDLKAGQFICRVAEKYGVCPTTVSRINASIDNKDANNKCMTASNKKEWDKVHAISVLIKNGDVKIKRNRDTSYPVWRNGQPLTSDDVEKVLKRKE